MPLSKFIKRLIVSIIGITVSAFIWHINRNIFGNIIRTCLILSTTTFLLVYVPFEIYFSIRTIWYDRWENISSDKLKTISVKIPINNQQKFGYIVANLVKPSMEIKSELKNKIIIISHGYSDTKETLQYLYYPLALQGYTILSYDSRGSGGSKKLGKRNQFLKRIEDYRKIIDWIQNDEELKKFEIFSIGFSMGAVIAISAGFTDPRIKKIIAISCISRYKQNVLRFNPIILIGYILRGIPLFPNEIQNKKLSPYFIFKRNKSTCSENEFKKLTNKIYLIHSKNDSVIKFRNFQENKSILDLSGNHQLIFKRGGHTMKKNELAIVGGILFFINQ
ncbi:MAG: alpha/beta fold hydrolase [Promethearchaeota archaeon]|nr:MAG: alpha/beta fold hydrolase [Candidatus Lokiarchaeota archaeon]